MTDNQMTQSIQGWLNEIPPITKPAPGRDGALHIEIADLEASLDEGTELQWQTQNFKPKLYQDEVGDMCCYASIELMVFQRQVWTHEDEHKTVISGARTFVGACNFKLKELIDASGNLIKDWCATAKSNCVKNAASDWGTKTGRGLNAFLKVANSPSLASVRQKMKPDNSIRSSYEAAKANDNKKIIKVLEETYDFNATETKD